MVRQVSVCPATENKILSAAMGHFRRLTGPWWENFVSSKPSVLKQHNYLLTAPNRWLRLSANYWVWPIFPAALFGSRCLLLSGWPPTQKTNGEKWSTQEGPSSPLGHGPYGLLRFPGKNGFEHCMVLHVLLPLRAWPLALAKATRFENKHQRCQQGLARASTCKDGPSSAGSEAWAQQYRSKLWSIEMFLPGDHRSSMFPKCFASWFSPFMLHMLTASNSQQVGPTERGQNWPVRISIRNLLHPLGTPNLLGYWHRR